jgi:hypothetical protein
MTDNTADAQLQPEVRLVSEQAQACRSTGICCRVALAALGIPAAIILPALLTFAFLFVKPIVLLVIVGLAQGILAGLALRLITQRLALTRTWRLTALSVLSGIASALLVYLILYLREVLAIGREILPPGHSLALEMLNFSRRGPYAALSQFMTIPLTGHRGFLGYILYRMNETSMFTHTFLVHVGVTILFTWRLTMFVRGPRLARKANSQLIQNQANVGVAQQKVAV